MSGEIVPMTFPEVVTDEFRNILVDWGCLEPTEEISSLTKARYQIKIDMAILYARIEDYEKGTFDTHTDRASEWKGIKSSWEEMKKRHEAVGWSLQEKVPYKAYRSPN